MKNAIILGIAQIIGSLIIAAAICAGSFAARVEELVCERGSTDDIVEDLRYLSVIR